jgi:hypothetical protein
VPILRGQLTDDGAIVDLLVGVTDSRRALLEKHHFPVPERSRIAAQIDTGSKFSAIDGSVFQQLGIGPHERVLVRTPVSAEREPEAFSVYAVSLSLPSGDGWEWFLHQVEVIGCFFAADEGIKAMLGRDVLTGCIFHYDGHGGTFSLSY